MDRDFADLRHARGAIAKRDQALIAANARIMHLERALLLMFEAYEGVYDMRDPPRQSDSARRAEGLAKDVLAENLFVK